jgi:hypothetical protein
MVQDVQSEEVQRFYLASLYGLHMLDGRSGQARRFGPEADARWAGFAGHLGLGDRVDMLLRDAAVVLGPAFSAAQIFQLPGLAEDEPFGPDWAGLAEETAKSLWHDAEGQHELDPDGDSILNRCISALGLEPPVKEPQCDGLASTTRLLVTGAAATVALTRAFAGDASLSWTEQVVVVASSPAERQLAGLAAVILGRSGSTRLVSPLQDGQGKPSPAEIVKQAGLTSVDRALVSEDADPACAAFARAAAASRPGV